ncbi:hypothetical protein JIQ42_04011 [Leishmania sp. Namibia]|uniref:hypothetical protein n=1 Tax=Leishmania sp. Namibia TaxID=2802991 RepID=UPI001B492506|nr:hypothetical protein JIQ42_04011 [Leishmania sp. Namibia]
MSVKEVPDSNKLFSDAVFDRDNAHIASQWQRIAEVYPNGVSQPLLPEAFSRDQFGQGNHYECFMISALATLIRFPDVIRNCFVTKKVRQDGRYTFQFFRGKEWVKVEIDDRIAMEEGEVLYARSPTEHWWPLLLEKAYAKFYTAYDHLEGCTLLETFHDLTGNPVLNIPMDAKLAKAAGAEVTEGFYWLGLAQRIHSGQFVASVLTKDIELENMGLQREQQYGVLEIFSLTGTSSINDIVIHLHNPFEDEEYLYKGPLNSKDMTWDEKQRARHDVDDERSIFLPLNTFLKIMNSVQLCYMTPVEVDATYFHDEWKGESAGGNPTSVSWRKNPLYFLRNSGSAPLEIVVVIKQEDQRRFTSPDEMTKYLQCGMVLIHNCYANPISTFWVTGNNHKPIHKSLFLNSREVANTMTIPPNSLCYLVPSCMHKGADGPFTIALYRMKDVDYSDLTINKLALPSMNWAGAATKNVELRQKEKDRVDFYVDEGTDIHILMHQTKPFVSKSGGDAMTEDYMGMYLYDDTDRKVAGVHAATNFREISIIHHLPRSGRYAISITCPRGKDDVPAYITIVGSHASNVRIVDPPEDATMFDDEDIIDEGEDAAVVANPIDFVPFIFDAVHHSEQAESDSPFEDKRFYMDNRGATSEPWVHIGDLYPEGKTKPLLPSELRRDQFGQGDHYDCSTLTAFAALIENHPEVIRNCFISKNPRKDGRYTFQFHRYGQWVRVEIDDRIPMVKGDTVFCRSPTHHWWPLLLEKAYAKFYTLYQNLEDISQGEVFHDFTGRPVIFIPMEVDTAKAVNYDIKSAQFWRDLNSELDQTALAALALGEQAEGYGLHHECSYAVLGFIETRNAISLTPADVLVKMYNPYEDSPYSGPMHKDDSSWTSEMRSICNPAQRSVFYMPANVFLDVFANMQQVYVKGPLDPCWNFNSEWGDTTNGGNASLVSWRENPLYVVRNKTEDPVQIIGMIRQPDQRHLLHRQTVYEVNYIQCALVVAESVSSERIPTYLVTGNNHRRLRSGLYLQNREVADVMTIPADSLCYIVPTGMHRDKGKFIFSYWFVRSGDRSKVDITRLNTDVARQLPAIAHVGLVNKGHARVDIVVDVPTDLHILLKQEKPFKHPSGGDAIAQDFLSMYLYDSNDKRISPSTQATNNREISLVQHVSKPGRYAIGVNCTSGTGLVPCKVEVVAQERAHVRITEAPENARELGELDLSFLNPEPEGVPLADLLLDKDLKFQEQLDALKRLHHKPQRKEEEILALERKMNDRAHDLARALLGKDRLKYLSGLDVEKLSPLLEDDPAYMNAERERHNLKKDPRNAGKVRQIEEELRVRAAGLADTSAGITLGFMDPEYEGIPRDDIELLSDAIFEEMAQARAGLLSDPTANARRINDMEDMMHERATKLAKDMHTKERAYLDPEPEGVPLDLLPLNEDAVFSRWEDELRGLYRKPKRDVKAIKDLQKKLNDRAHELAGGLKSDERELFLDPVPLGIPVADLPLETDPGFHVKEIERLQLRKEDPLGKRDDIKALEDALNERARELAKDQHANQRAFLDQDPYGVPLERLGLDYNDDFLRRESELCALQKDPRRNAKAIADLKGDMRDMVNALAAAEAARDRSFLDPEVEGRLLQSVPLLENPEFKELDTKRRRLLYRGGDMSKAPDMEDRMNDIAIEIAHGMNVAERPDYMDTAYKGIPMEDLPLDEDHLFHSLEVRRQQQKQDPRRNARGITDTEQELNDRAMELATEKLKSDRNYLDPEPEGVPLRLVPLDIDLVFTEMEAQRAKLKKDLRRNTRPIADLEDKLNDRAHELAKALKEKERPKFLDARFSGIPYTELPLDADQPFRDMEVQRLLLKEQPHKNATAIQDLEEALSDRAGELAKDKLAKERGFLDPCPLGIPLDELPLDCTPTFLAKEERLRALNKDPCKNAAAIKTLQGEMNDMVNALAAEELGRVRGFLDPEPEGRLIESLPLSDDPQFHKLEAQYRELKKNPKANPQDIADREELMNDRAHEVAKDMNRKERPSFMNLLPKGVPLEELPLDTDEEFSNLEAQRARLMRQPAKNKKAIGDIEDALNLRAEELAQEKIQADRAFMEDAPQNIPLKYIPLDKDKEFGQTEEELRRLEKNPVANRQGIRDLKEELNFMAHEKAKRLLQGDRAYLDQNPEGVDLCHVPLDSDPEFHELETRRAKLKSEDLRAHQKAITALEDQLNSRAHELAREVKEGEVRALEPDPHGIPYAVIVPHNDDQFNELAKHLRDLKTDPKRNAAAIKEMSDRMNDRGAELAEAMLKQDRSYLEQQPAGVPLQYLPLDSDSQFNRMEVERAKLKADPRMRSEQLQQLVDAMNNRAHELAREMLRGDRTAYLEEAAKGVPIDLLPLDTDPQFHDMEVQRAVLKAQDLRRASVDPMRDLLNNRLDEMAKQLLEGDRAYLDLNPEGVPLRVLPLDEDPDFNEMEVRRAVLKAKNPKKNAAAIKDLEDKLNDRAHELAKEALSGDRGYLVPEPKGVPLADLPLDDDFQFHQMEVERAKELRRLKSEQPNHPKIKELQAKLDNRANELAKAQIDRDRAFLDPEPEGIPLTQLPLDSDRPFTDLEKQLRQTKQDPKRNAEKIASLQEYMNERAHELARGLLKGDRGYLDPEPENVPIADVPIDADAEFRELEAQRAKLKEDPRRNADTIKDLEDRLNSRAHALAKALKEAARSFLNPTSHRVPRALLPLDEDAPFAKMEQQLRRAQRRQDNRAEIESLERVLNDRAAELAKGQRQKDRAFLDPEPEGIPITDVPLDSDQNFLRLEDYLRKLKRDLRRNADAIADTQESMNDRAHELAKGVVAEDLACLPRAAYRGIPKEELPLDADKDFAALEAERRRRVKDPRAAKRNKDVVRDLEDKMNDRAHQLAKDEFAKQRHFMDQEPEGVPLERLPLDIDPEFKDVEMALHKAKKDPQADPKKVAALEKRMNDRAHELARAELAKDRAFLDPEPEGVPLADLPLSDDPEFNNLAKLRQTLKNNRRSRDPEVRDLEDKMNDRVHTLAKDFLNTNRSYLNPEPQNVPVADIPLNRDPIFRDMENDLMRAKKDPRSNADKIAEMQDDLNSRADDLARDLLRKERAHQEQEPLGVPLEELPLNYDPILNPLERKRRDLKKAPKRNADALRSLELEIAARVEDIARDFLAKERAFLDQEPEGVPLERLALSEDKEFREMERELRSLKKQPAKNKDAVEDLEERMNDRANELAKEYLAKDRDYLEKEPLGVPLEELPLNEDSAFREMEQRRRALKKDARGSAKAIKELEDRLNGRAEQLAQQRLDKDRAFLDIKPEGILVKDLPLDKDKAFRDMERQLRQLRKDPRKNVNAIRDLEEDMNHRAHTLAKRQLADDRNFLNPEPRGVPLVDLALDDDVEFRKTELARREAKKDPKNAAKVRELETLLNEHAERIASEYLKRDRAYLDPEPEGVALEELPLDTDPDFHGMEVDRRKLNKDPAKNYKIIKELEEMLNSRAHELAKEKKGYQDLEFHEVRPEGISRDDIPLISDEAFAKMMSELVQLRRAPEDSDRNAAAIASLEKELGGRAAEILKKHKEAARAFLIPYSVDLDAMSDTLGGSSAFVRMEDELCQLRKSPRRNASAIQALEEEMAQEALQLVAQCKRQRRSKYLDAEHEGRAVEALSLDDDAVFRDTEAAYLKMRDSGSADPAALQRLVNTMNQRATSIARSMNVADRPQYLPKALHGVPLQALPLEDDDEFRRMEQERSRVACTPGREAEVAALEERLTARAAELARAVLSGDRGYLDEFPEGIPLACLHIDDDDVFRVKEEQRASLQADGHAEASRSAIAALEMNSRARELAKGMLEGDRGYLSRNPEGVPLEELPLDTDDEFHAMEVERVKLKLTDPRRQAAAISSLEATLNQRAAELAKHQRVADLAAVDDAPRGLAKELLDLHSDSEGAALIKDLRRLRKSPGRSAGVLREEEAALNDRAFEVARRLLEGDRDSYLDPRPRGVPLEDLPLNKDDVFHALEVERATLKITDPMHNAAAVHSTESMLNDRAYQLAVQVMKEDLANFPPSYHGIPTADLEPHSDRLFREAAEMRRLRMRDPTVALNENLEKIMEDRLNELARERKEGNLYFMDPSPAGVPLPDVPLSSDKSFNDMLQERQQLRENDPMAHRKAIAALEDKMRNRAAEIARNVLNSDFDGVDKLPFGIPLDLLEPRQDAEVARLIQELRRWKRSPQLKNRVVELQAKLNERVHALAAAALEEGRDTYLDFHPEGVPLELLPLRTDDAFHEKEVQRAILHLQDPAKYADRIAQLEQQLNARAHELALAQKEEDLRELNQHPHDLPLTLLQPHQDALFSQWVDELRRLKASPGDQRKAIKEVIGRMNERGYAMADSVTKGDRRYLHPKPANVPLSRLSLDADAAFHALEVERAKLKLTDPRKNQHRIADLEDHLNIRAAELAMAVKATDLKSLAPTLRGIPVELLNLHEDPKFEALIAEKEKLPRGCSAEAVTMLLCSMNDCAMKAADKLLIGDRGYLDQEVEGVPLAHLPLDTDTDFHEMEVERAVLKTRDPVKNSFIVNDLEDQLKKRAHEIANAALAMDRDYLIPMPEGVPIEELPLNTDSKFHSMEVERARLRVREAEGNVARVQELEGRLNDRAAALARKQLEEDLQGLDREPEGYPLKYLRLHTDAVFAAEVVPLRRAKVDPVGNAMRVREIQATLNARAHALARVRIVADRARLDQEPNKVPLVLLPLDKDARFVALEKELRMLKAAEKQSPKTIAEAEGRMNDRAHVLAAKVKAKGREFLRSKSSDIPKELLVLDEDMAFVAKEKELRKLLLHQPDAPHFSLAAANLRRELQLRADEVGEAQLRGDREKYLDVQPEGVDLCDIPLDTDNIYHQVEVERAILRTQGATSRDSAVAALEKKLNARAHELAHQIVVGDRDYLPKEMHGIPVEELPLDTDARFKELERQRRAHRRSPNMRKELVADEEELRNHALELANEVIALDLEPIKAFYRGIPKEELNLHADSAFRELAKRRRWHRGKGGRVEATEMTAIEDEMDRRACEIADDVIDKERAFLDQEPEGMYLIEVPLDDDPTFQKLEHEYRRRCKDPLATKQNGDVLRELAEEMNQRSHTLARAAFAKIRDFMEPEPEGIPLEELGLDEDPEFKEAEIARYRTNRSSAPDAAMVAEMELRMDNRARELARATLAADRAFLDPKPEGVSLEVLPLDTDKEFGDLARERRRRKKTLKGGMGDAEVRAVEEKMNARSHEMAKEFLQAERAFLSREPEGVPLDDLPLNTDPLFRAMEDERLQWKRDLLANATMRAAKETELEERAHVIAKELLRKERAFLDPEPLGVPLEELPLNFDNVLNPVERKRRALRMHSKRNHEAIRACEEQMVDRVLQIAAAFVEKERAFLDQNPEGVPLRYLPLNTDREFHDKELHRRKLLQRCERNRGEIADTERKMNERVHALAKDLVLKGRAFLHAEPCGVPIADVPLNEDEQFRKMEEKRRALKEAGRSAASVKAIEEKLNERAEVLAQRLLDEERAFMDGTPLGIPLHDLPLNRDPRMREIERTRRQLRKSDPEGGAAEIAVLESGMNARAYELADQLLRNDRGYLHPEPRGVPLVDLPLHTDRIFHKTELARFRAKKDGQTNLVPMENELNKRAMELAAEFIRMERAYLDQEVEGVALERLQLDTDLTFHKLEQERRRLKRSGENPPLVLELEHLLNLRAHELAMELRGWQDPEFHARNEHVAEQWVRVCELYPDGRYEPFEPAAPAPGDVVSAPRDVGYLAPFIAALSRHPVLLQRLIATKEAPVNAPYTFVFFDPHSNPVYVDVDDRVPCTQEHEPKFLQSSYHQWYPLLLEKAYAKFVGGYERLVNCTSLETLRDLTGRPVTHTPFDLELAEAANLGRYTSVDFWLRVAEDMARGDVVLCSSNAKVPDGIHPLCSYALVGVVVTLEGSTNPSDVVIKLENSYRNDEPIYTGPLCHTDVNWSQALQRVCQYDHGRDDVLYLPLPTFLRNFSSMQTCRINCGDRLTATGAWDNRTSGGSAKFTSFRNNPVFVLQNSSSRTATVISELRHASPLFVDPDGASHYLPSGVILMEPTSASAPLTPLITNSTARFLQRGIMLDSREVCSTMEIPANSTCLLIPYTAKVGQHGSFFLSVYPGCAKISFAPLHYCGLSREPKSTAVTLTPGAEGQRVDFTISSACDVHVLLRQEKMIDLLAAVEGDAIADDDVVMVAFSDQAMKLTSSGEATNAREHSLVFRAEKPGYYSLLLASPNQPVSGVNPCTVSIFTPKRVLVKFVPPPAGARPLQQTRLPTLPQRFTKNTCTNNPRRLPVSIAARQSQQRQRKDSLPPLRSKDASTLSPGPVSHSVLFSCSF